MAERSKKGCSACRFPGALGRVKREVERPVASEPTSPSPERRRVLNNSKTPSLKISNVTTFWVHTKVIIFMFFCQFV